MSLLDVRDLHVKYLFKGMSIEAVKGVNFQLQKGQALGIAGETGCGKSSTALSLLRLLPQGTEVTGKVMLENTDLLHLSTKELNKKIRWSRVSMVFQGALHGFDPVTRVGDQIVEAILLHEKRVSKADARKRAIDLAELVGVDPKRLQDYPHQLSGGMKQRLMIAMALSCNPSVIIADEPVTALDVISKKNVISVLNSLRAKLGLALVLITHDLWTAAQVCDTVIIMYAGRVVEQGNIVEVIRKPQHPYTIGILKSNVGLTSEKVSRFYYIEGHAPRPMEAIQGCPFNPRCPYVRELCRSTRPELRQPSNRQGYVACHFAEEIAQLTQVS